MKLSINDLGIEKRQLDLTDTLGGVVDIRSLKFGNVLLTNAVDSVKYNDEAFQVHICEHCLIQGCQSGGWTSLRKIGSYAVMVPAAHLMREGRGSFSSYSPPNFMYEPAIPTFSRQHYSELIKLIDGLPEFDSIRPLSSLEALTIHQLAAPGFFLGEAGDKPNLEKDKFVAVTEGDLEIELEALQDLLNCIEDEQAHGYSIKPDRLVEFHLDLPEFPAWSGFGYASDMPVLNFAEFSSQ